MNYFDVNAVSASLLKSIQVKSVVHAMERMKTFKANDSMNLGTAVHCRVLEPHLYESSIAVSPKVDRRTKAGKEAYAEFVKVSEGKTVISELQDMAAFEMSNMVMEHTQARMLLEGAKYEQEYFYDYEGASCKAKIDAVKLGKIDNKYDDIVIDIKTTIDASPSGFSKQSANFNYHMQMAWYAHAIGSSWRECNCYVIAVENTAPYSVAVYKYPTEVLQTGWELCTIALQKYQIYKEAEKRGSKVFAYTNQVLDIKLPAWAERKENATRF